MPISCASVLTDVLASRPELGGFRDHSDSERVEHQDNDTGGGLEQDRRDGPSPQPCLRTRLNLGVRRFWLWAKQKRDTEGGDPPCNLLPDVQGTP